MTQINKFLNKIQIYLQWLTLGCRDSNPFSERWRDLRRRTSCFWTILQLTARKMRREMIDWFLHSILNMHENDLSFLGIKIFKLCVCRMQVLGTKGRVCNQTSDGPSGCLIMCCGRGYQTMLREGVDSCNCQFVWCCRVECDKCPYKRDEHICNWNNWHALLDFEYMLNLTIVNQTKLHQKSMQTYFLCSVCRQI